jgi:hypothetical protein
VVLSDHERETLREVQRRLATEDPAFVRSFETTGQPDSHCSFQWLYGLPRWAYTTTLVVAVALGLLMLLVQSPATAFGFAALATVIAAARRQPRATDGPGGPDE